MILQNIFQKHLARTCTTANIVIILAATLTPGLSGSAHHCSDFDKNFIFLKWVEASGLNYNIDILKNLLLFFPLGICLSWYLHQILSKNTLHLISYIFLFCFGFSYSIELTQIFLPTRCAALNDVLCNTLGGFAGSILYFYKRYFLIGWLTAGLLLSIPLQQKTVISNWDDNYFLLIGNELTGDRPWKGLVSGLFLTDAVVPPKNIEDFFSGDNTDEIFGNSLIASFRLHEPNDIKGKAAKNLPLKWTGPTGNLQPSGILTNEHQWLQTNTPAQALTKKIKDSGHFTIGITAQTDNSLQHGPARIVSLSANPLLRNFTIGQNDSDLIIRMRTPLTGLNGSNPEFKINDVFVNSENQKMVITYDGSVLRTYINSPGNQHSFELSPGAVAASYFTDISPANLQLYKMLYYFCLFSPLGLYLTKQNKLKRSYSNHNVMRLCFKIVIPALILEFILVCTSGKSFLLVNIIIAITLTTAPTFMYTLYGKTKRFFNFKSD